MNKKNYECKLENSNLDKCLARILKDGFLKNYSNDLTFEIVDVRGGSDTYYQLRAWKGSEDTNIRNKHIVEVKYKRNHGAVTDGLISMYVSGGNYFTDKYISLLVILEYIEIIRSAIDYSAAFNLDLKSLEEDETFSLLLHIMNVDKEKFIQFK